MGIIQLSTGHAFVPSRALWRAALVVVAALCAGVVSAVFPDIAVRTLLAIVVLAPALVVAWWAVANDSRIGSTLAAAGAFGGVLVLASMVNDISIIAGLSAIVAGGALFGWITLQRRGRHAVSPGEQPGLEETTEPIDIGPPENARVLLAQRMKGQRPPRRGHQATAVPRAPGPGRWVQLQSNRTRPRPE